MFDATFKEALSYLLATKVAMALTGDAEIYKLAMQQFQLAINDATLVNGTNVTSPKICANRIKMDNSSLTANNDLSIIDEEDLEEE